MEDFLKQKTAHLNLSSHIKFAGLVPRNDMPDYFGAADCYIISSDYEGTSISLMEAMFNQLPIIGTNAPGINHMLSHERNALLYQANDAEQLASHIKAMIIDRSSAGRLAKNAGQDFENKYSYGKMIEQYRNLFASLPFGPKRQYQPDSVNRMAIEGSKEFNKNEKVKL